MVLGRNATATKFDEITAIPLPPEGLDLAGALGTIDAMGTRVALAEIILRRGGGDLLAFESNRPATRDDVARFFGAPRPT